MRWASFEIVVLARLRRDFVQSLQGGPVVWQEEEKEEIINRLDWLNVNNSFVWNLDQRVREF